MVYFYNSWKISNPQLANDPSFKDRNFRNLASIMMICSQPGSFTWTGESSAHISKERHNKLEGIISSMNAEYPL